MSQEIQKKRDIFVKERLKSYKQAGMTKLEQKEIRPLLKKLAAFHHPIEPLSAEAVVERDILETNIQEQLKDDFFFFDSTKPYRGRRRDKSFAIRRLKNYKKMGVSASDLNKLEGLLEDLSAFQKGRLDFTEELVKRRINLDINVIIDSHRTKSVKKKPYFKSKKSSRKVSVGSRSVIYKDEYAQHVRDSRDATRDYAHHFRENGRFGSHPVHDDYGDESDPD